MPDISLCTNSTCTLRDLCYRYRAIPSGAQSYTHFESQDCKDFESTTGRVDLLPTKTVDANHVERR